MSQTNTHRYTGTHAAEIVGKMLGPGEFFSLTKDQLNDPHIKEMLENGTLLALDKKGGES